MVVALLAAELDSRSVDLLDRAALAHERVDRHERRAHRRLCETKIVRARDLERLAERVQGLRRVTSTRAHVDESALGPTERDHVRALLLEREGPQVSALRRVELAEKVVQLRESERFRELAGTIREKREYRLGLEVRAGCFLDLAEIGV